jgi:type IV pilus assembly protein PilA
VLLVLRKRLALRDAEAGFTLIELLVVMLILGILAAIALPSFFNQRNKANDAKAKEYAHSAQVAMETYSTSNGGSGYLNASVAKLKEIEPTLNSAGTFTVTGSTGAGSTPTATAYMVTMTSSTGNTFAIKNISGVTTFPCTVPSTATDRGGCPGSGTAAGTWG